MVGCGDFCGEVDGGDENGGVGVDGGGEVGSGDVVVKVMVVSCGSDGHCGGYKLFISYCINKCYIIYYLTCIILILKYNNVLLISFDLPPREMKPN